MKPIIDITNRQVSESGLPLGASLFCVFLTILFGANAVAMKISLTGLGPFTTAGMRFSVAALAIMVWALLTGKPLLVRNGQFKKLMVLGAVFFVQLSLFYLGMTRTTASHGTLIANLLPFVVMVLAHFFIRGDRIVLKKTLGLVFGFTGVIVLFSDTGASSEDMMVGDLCVLLAVVVWGINAVYTKRIIPAFHPVQITVFPMLMASPLFLFCGFLWDGGMVKTVNTEIIAALLYQTFVTASFGMVAWNSMIRKYGATSLHAFVFIMPLSGVFLGVTLLGEPVTFRLILAVVLVVTGLIVVNTTASVSKKGVVDG